MNILFITQTRLGDAVLSTGLLAHLAEKYPDARITVVCGPLPAPLFVTAPGVVRILAPAKQKHGLHWLKLWKACVGTKWDIVVDLRNSALSRTLRARQRFIWKKSQDGLHKVEELGLVMGLVPPPAPRLWVSDSARMHALALVPDGGPVLAIGPAANWFPKMWPAERFATLIEELTAPHGILTGARVAVIAAEHERAQAEPVLHAIPEDRWIDLIGKGDALLAAACLERCALYVGNDSGLMHMAAALDIPTLGLFGPGQPDKYRPWGHKTTYVSTTRSREEMFAEPGFHWDIGHTLMDTLSTERAIGAAEALWRVCHTGDE